MHFIAYILRKVCYITLQPTRANLQNWRVKPRENASELYVENKYRCYGDFIIIKWILYVKSLKKTGNLNVMWSLWLSTEKKSKTIVEEQYYNLVMQINIFYA